MLHQALPATGQVKLFQKKHGKYALKYVLSELYLKKTPEVFFRELPLHAVVSAAAFSRICAEPAAFSRLLHEHIIVRKSI